MKLLALLGVAGALFAQDQWFTAEATGTLAAAGTTATIQQIIQGPRDIKLFDATVVCPAACTITQAQNGTAAGTTPVTTRGLNPNPSARSIAAVFQASNVGPGTPVGGRVVCSAACTVVLDLSPITLQRGSPNTNYSISISAVTGDFSISFRWREQ